MNTTERVARIERLREQIKLLRKHATNGHEPYIVDALELIVDLLEEKRP